MSMEEYAELAQTGYKGGSSEKTPPEDEFFHSIYIAGTERKNHINIVEKSKKIQIRGVQYNLDEVNMIITHTKEILANIKSEKGRDNIACFSFKENTPPWYGTSKLGDSSARQCPQTSAERAVNDFCNSCRAQILVAGIYCKADGSPILTEENKPIFVFIRGKGMKYSNISNYLNDRYNEENLTPIFEPVTEQSTGFEKSVVNNKRFVVKLTQDAELNSYGNMVNMFALTKGTEIPKESVLSILKLSKQTVDQFNNKFDWSKGKQASGYGQTTPEGVLSVGEETATEPEEKQEEGDDKTFSFDDIKF